MKHLYCIGIGGIGVSALARKYLNDGWRVSGSDRAHSLVTEELEKLGAKVFFEQKAANITPDLDLIIYTIAIPENQAELVRARELGIKTMSYPEALGELSRDYFTVAVAGTHGKTTTTAMLAKICIAAGRDPTVIVGSFLTDGGSNFIPGKSDLLIVEACEYRRSFLNLEPKVLIITNIDNDHLDYYRDLGDIKSAFAEFAKRLPSDGTLITEREYSKIKTDFKLKVPGLHNVHNAQAALSAAAALGINYLTAIEALENFSGSWRRFEYKGKTDNGALVYDDYAHHPTEIRATLSGAKEIAKKKIFVVFQPHLYSRTKLLFNDFATSFTDADAVIVSPIYAARERADMDVSGGKLAEAIGFPKTCFLENFDKIATYLKQKTGPDDLIITMGAGDISELAGRLL
ncbi:UDP-N-acetylmuramate--L-alanine ligase [Candidatus Nomurabacteria bacterium]|nr:UDP-N-acetylmuramate--L-alanine ligase [Candidatus Nomurabacteria bacterium]